MGDIRVLMERTRHKIKQGINVKGKEKGRERKQ